ncbi:MAG: glycosyltransferase family 2 protein [Actinomycetota bacterium]|nr:glycosyltransferase family 2 protein [Actinomycetota bacterium]
MGDGKAFVISVCIPAYNRASVLQELLDSILQQTGVEFEIVIAEDGSPERGGIRSVVAATSARWPGVIRYFENRTNLGYDGNLRQLFQLARGEYCLFMGNDDLMCPAALATVEAAIQRYPDVGAVMRTYATFDSDPRTVREVFRYFPNERFFPAGADSVVTFFRRMVVISGIVLNRKAALRCATERHDGSLLYQLHVVANILAEMNGVFLPEVLTLYRLGGIPDFGHSASEQGKFVPGRQTPASSLHFMQGMLEIARAVEADRGLPVFRPIVRDLGNYSFPFIAIQRRQPVSVFLAYCGGLARLGFARVPLFWAYCLGLLVLGERIAGGLVTFLRRRIGHAPKLGMVYGGEAR